ncbi:MAG: UDP-glucose 4-epimerase GalE, partial [Hyphomicrobiaceae bacterium]|nr:UDP-glucose 4-epimerase GalE [Hyphomicrobiaceae bacterium]
MGAVLITGGAGYIGSHTVYAFIDAGAEVVVLDDLSTGMRSTLPSQAAFYQGCISDRALVTRIVREHRIEGALHFAGSIVVPESVANPAKYYRNNTSRALELADTLIAAGVTHFVFSSTAAVYGAPERVPIPETAPLQPINPYGWSKLFFERQLADLGAAHGLACAVLRYFNVAGADPRGRTGQSTPQATHLIKVACQAATGLRDDMRVFGTDYPTKDGTCVRDFIHVSDLAEAHVAAYALLQRSGESATFNCGNGRGYSVREVIAAVESAAGRPLRLAYEGRRAGDPPELVADPSLLLERVAWRPRFGLA